MLWRGGVVQPSLAAGALREVVVCECRGHTFPVWDVAMCGQGHYFASASADRTSRVWCTERAQPLRTLVGHHSDVSVVRWHPNCHYVATGSHDRTVRLWDIRDGRSQRILVGHRSAVGAPADRDTHFCTILLPLNCSRQSVGEAAPPFPIVALVLSFVSCFLS